MMTRIAEIQSWAFYEGWHRHDASYTEAQAELRAAQADEARVLRNNAEDVKVPHTPMTLAEIDF